MQQYKNDNIANFVYYGKTRLGQIYSTKSVYKNEVCYKNQVYKTKSNLIHYNVNFIIAVQSRSYTRPTWLGGIVTPEDRNSTSARNYTWSYTNETVSDAIFPWANRTIFPDTVGETCLYWDAFEIKEAPCDSDGVDGGNTYIICETVHDMPLTFNDIPHIYES